MNTIQELAKQIVKIDWAGVQSDSVEANEQFQYLKQHVLRLTKFEAVSLLFEVMEAQLLNIAFPRTIFSEMLEFPRMNHAYLSFVPSNGEPKKPEDFDPWFDLCVKLDTMARYQDNKHFGLPMGDIYDLINSISHEFTITKKTE